MANRIRFPRFYSSTDSGNNYEFATHTMLTEYLAHYHTERNHQGVGNRLLESLAMVSSTDEPIQRRECLGGMLNFYHRQAA
jgi:hypothetical protein